MCGPQNQCAKTIQALLMLCLTLEGAAALQAYQLFKARAYGADAVLLIAAVLPNNDLEYLIAAARKIGLQCLVEVRIMRCT